jgi:hypothetical protein
MQSQNHDVDICVIGGGISGLCAAVAAARHGARVLLMHDRPVLGGNASSEVRMWIGGCWGPHLRETGIIEEIHLDNMRRNPTHNYSQWDALLYEKAFYQPGLTTILNCSCLAVTKDGARIAAVKGWQAPNETWHTVNARIFIDCTGDALPAELAGAEIRRGREARGEFGEAFGPEAADELTMGNSVLIQARELPHPVPFIAPAWAHTYPTCADLPNRGHVIGTQNFWWLELGGDQDAIHDGDAIRDELLRVAFGVWDHIKNRCTAQDASHWDLEWIGFLPGKRESRRIIGDHILSQPEVAEGRPFEDIVAYGGWSMDDHTPYGFRDPGQPTHHHRAAQPYGIPFRCLYSRDIPNLLMAGRNISASHAAFSSTRVMATCAVMGQAVGTAAALGIAHELDPRQVGEQVITDLQAMLMEDDCYLPGLTRTIAPLSISAALTASTGDPDPFRDGIDRVIGDDEHAWHATPGAWAAYGFAGPTDLHEARLVFDSNQDRPTTSNMPSHYPLDQPANTPPPELVRAYRLEAEIAPGQWQTVHTATDNHQRLVRVQLNIRATAVRLMIDATWGAEDVRVFAWEVG